MKLKHEKVISVFLAMMMLLSVMPAGLMTVNAAVTLSSLQSKYPSGKYWNGGNADSYTSKPCTHHTGNCSYSGSCGCNTFKGHCIQCMGFAYKLASLIYGGDPYTDWKNSSKSSSSVDSLKSGDIVCYKNGGHYIFVYDVNGDVVTYADCNSSGNCNIRWGQTITKAQIKSTFYSVDRAPSAWNGGSGSHTHSYSGSYFEGVHPHRVYQKCSCGKTKYTGATRAYQNCSTCMKLSTAYVMPVKAYTINTGKTTVYSSVNGTAKSNKIYDTDLCTISQIYDCGWCKVTFPLDAGGTETGYCKTSIFMKDGGYIVYTSKQITSYRRSDLKISSGYAGSGDKIYVLGNTSSAVQIAYPLTAGGWKVGWMPISAIKCTLSYNANGGTGSMSNTSSKYKSSFTLSENKFVKTGYTFSGWNVYRNSDKKWYVSGKGWKTASEISSKGYTKKLYKNKWDGTLDSSWINLGKTNDKFTFYAVWTPNTLSVYYNANGGTVSSDTYKLSNNIVYNKSNSSKYMQKWTYNSTKTNGLVNATTFGLTREGYTFKGWGTTASGGTVFNQNDTTLVPSKINANIKNGSCSSTLYAIWALKTYSIKFDANGGTGTPTAQTKTHGKSLTLSSTIPARDGYSFLGWSTSKTATSAVYQPGDTYTGNSGITLYAVWQAVPIAPTHTHEWNTDYSIDKEATCTEPGSKSIHCKGCNETKDAVSIPIIEHNFEEFILKEASCTEKGEKVKRCLICGTETDKSEIPTTEHNFISTITTEATCACEGEKENVCSECGLHTNKEIIPILDHEFGEWKVEKDATAEADGIESRQCVNCGYSETRNIEYIPVYDEDAPRISMTSVDAKAGEEVEVQIKMENNPGITALRLIIDFDENALEMTGFSFGDALSSMNKGTSEKYGNHYSFSMYSATTDLSDCGIFAIIKFKVKDNTVEGEYPITITYDPDDIFNLNGDRVDFDMETGAIIVNSCLLGDMNDDGKINMRDVVLLQQVVNGWDVTYNKSAADYNEDDKINMRDIVALQQYING